MKSIGKKSVSQYKVNQTVSKIPVGGFKKIPPRTVIPQVPVAPPQVVQQVAPQPQIAPIPKPIQAPVQAQIAPKKEIIPEIRPDATSTQIIDLTNAYRTAQKLTPYRFNPLLSKSAQKRAQEIANNIALSQPGEDWKPDDAWVHNGWYEAILGSGYQGATNNKGQVRAGENLAKDFNDINSAIRGWQRSQKHNANLTNANFQDIGIGYATYKDPKTGKEKLIFVQHFGVPKQ